MDQALSNLVAACIGAAAGISGAVLTLRSQQRLEHKKWLREETKSAYSNALKALSSATVIPVGIDIQQIEKWFGCLSNVRESLTVLEVYCSASREQIIAKSRQLFTALEVNNYALLATTATTLRETEGDVSGLVLIGVGNIRANVVIVLDEVTKSARLDLQTLVVENGH